MVDAKAVEILREELEQSDNCSERVNHLSVKVKWGQNDLVQLGPLLNFIQRYPEVFTFVGQMVKLVNPRSSGPPSKAHRKGDYGGKGAISSKAGPYGGSPPPAKGGKNNGKGGGKGDEEDTDLDRYLDGGYPVQGAGAPTSKAKWAGDQTKGPEKGFGKGKDGKDAGNGKGGYDQGKGGGYDQGKGGGYDQGKGGGYDQGKGNDGGDKGKGAKGGKGHERESYDSNEELSPEARKLAIQEDRLATPQARKGIESFKTNGVDIELAMLTKKLLPGDEARRSAQRCLALVRSAISSQFGQPGPNTPTVVICGSYAQGTEVHGSAMDLAFRVPSHFSIEDKTNAVSELRSRLSQQTNFLETCDTLEHYPHTTSPMAIELKGSSPGLVAHVLLEEQRENRPATVDEVIKQLCDTFEASYPLVRLVKVWSLNHGLTTHADGFINGVAWTLLVIFFLQQQKLIPPYSIIASGTRIDKTTSPKPVSTLLHNFFEFLAKRINPALPRGFSVWNGEEFSGPPCIFIEDPSYFLETKSQKSASDTLGEAQWGKITEEAKKAYTRIAVRPGRWFHWAEIFDSFDPAADGKPARIMGLGQQIAPSSDMGDAKGFGKGEAPPSKAASVEFQGKGAGKDGKDMDGKGYGKDKSKGFGNDEGKGYGKDADGSKGWSGKDADGKGYGKASGKDSVAKGGKDSGKDFDSGKDQAFSGKDSFGKGGKDEGKGYGKDEGKGWGKDDSKGYGKSKGSSKGSKPYW